MAVRVADNFNRGNSTGLGANWNAGSGQTSLNVSSNTAIGPSGYGQSCWAADTLSANQFCSARAANVSHAANRHCYVGVRTNNGSVGGGYWLEFDDTNYRLYYTDSGGTDHNLETGATGFSTTDRATIRINGTTLNGWKNGVKITADYTDSNIANGPPAIACTDNNTAIDDFQAGDLDGTGVIVDNTSTFVSTDAGATGSWTIPHNNIAGVGLTVRVGMLSNSLTITGVTYNGTALTKLASTETGRQTYIFGWPAGGAALPTGINNVVVTASGTGRNVCVCIQSYIQVDTTTPYGTAVTKSGTNTTDTAALTSSSGDMCIDNVYQGDNTTPPVFTETFLVDAKQADLTASQIGQLCQSTSTTSPTMQWTSNENAAYSYAAIPVKAAAVTGQVAHPMVDISDGSWTDEDGGTTLYAAIDETSPDDADYIKSSSMPANDTCEVRLDSLSTPEAGTRTVKFRYRKWGTERIDLTVSLYENVTLVQETTINDIPAAWTDGSFDVTNSISNYADLRLKFKANHP